MRNTPEHVVFCAGSSAATGMNFTESTASSDSLATIMKNAVLLTEKPAPPTKQTAPSFKTQED